METGSTSETSANFYKTTRRIMPGDSHRHNSRRENIKTRLFKTVSYVRLNYIQSTGCPFQVLDI
jgi:hypothetical protein